MGRFVLLIISILVLSPVYAMTTQDFHEFEAWLSIDKTNENNYTNITYDCLAFSRNLVENATLAGFKDVYLVNIQSTKYDQGHWIIAVLVNGKYRFFEPQADIEVIPTKSQLLIVDDNFNGTKRSKLEDNNLTVSGEVLMRA